MSTTLTDDDVLSAIAAHTRDDGSINSTALAKALDKPRTSIQYVLKRLAREGRMGTKPVLPGFAIASSSAQINKSGVVEKEWIKQAPVGDPFEMPKGHVVKGVSTLVDQSGYKIAEWIKTREGDLSPEDFAMAIARAFDGFVPAAEPSPFADATQFGEGYLTFQCLPDLHLGMHAWGKEAGESWDLKIAEKIIGEAMDRLDARVLPSQECVILGGGDAMHADNNSNMTPRSGNILQVDGRFDKVLGVACRLHVRQIDLARRKHQRVLVRILKGNHDEHAAVAIAYFLSAYYRNCSDVVIDLDPSLFWFHQFGKVMLAATHGHAAKPEKMPIIMAGRQAKMWGETEFRFAHTFHIHHHEKRATEFDGVIVESHQAPIPQDAWHSGQGFLSGRSLQAIVYDAKVGEVGRAREPILRQH